MGDASSGKQSKRGSPTEPSRAEIRQLTEDLARSRQELEDFLNSASHDLKGPLRGIAGHAHVLLRNDKLSEDARQRLTSITRHVQHMDLLIQGMIDYAELGRATLSRDLVDLTEVVRHASDFLKREIKRRGAEVRVPRQLPNVRCDFKWVGQALLHLIENGLKYNENKEPWVEVGYLDNNSGSSTPVIFYVKDNGIGISSQHIDTVYNLFHRLHPPDAFDGGTGLGLAIAKRAVERHHGKLWLESQPGKGSTFFFTLGDASRAEKDRP